MDPLETRILERPSKEHMGSLTDNGSLDMKEKQESVKSSDINSTHDFVDEKILERPEGVALQVNRQCLLMRDQLVSRSIQVISTRDDPELPVLTFRVLFLGVGLSAFSAVSLFVTP